MTAPFVDTNILIYAHLVVPGDRRCERAFELLNGSLRFVISTQVVAEYSARMLRQKIRDADIFENVHALLQRFEVRSVTPAIVAGAWGIRQRYGFSYWDSQIIASALDAGCETLYSEDLQDGQRIEKRLTILNPLQA